MRLRSVRDASICSTFSRLRGAKLGVLHALCGTPAVGAKTHPLPAKGLASTTARTPRCKTLWRSRFKGFALPPSISQRKTPFDFSLSLWERAGLLGTRHGEVRVTCCTLSLSPYDLHLTPIYKDSP